MITLHPNRLERLDKYLAAELPQHSRSKLVRWIDQGRVWVDDKRERSSFELNPGMTVTLDEPEEKDPHDLTPADIKLDIVYEDADMLVVNKPRGLATHPATSLHEPSLVNALLARDGTLSEVAGEYRPGIVHRLDKETTGLLAVAKTDAAHVALARQIENKTAERRYLAIVRGHIVNEQFTISAPMGRDRKNRLKMAVDPKGKPAITHVRVLRKVDAGTLLACRLETGRTHQIRVHLKSINCPVVGDETYAPKEMHTAPLQLHAAKLAFDHPTSGERMGFFAAPPADFLAEATESDLD